MSTGRPTALALTEYLLLSKRTRQVFDTEAGSAWNPSKRPPYGISFGRSSSKTSQIVRSGLSGWACAFAQPRAFVEQPGVQLVIALEPQPRREEAFANKADLVLDLTLLPARRRRAGHRLDEVMRAHLEEAAIVLAVLADEDRLNRRLHVVVDAAPAGALEERERTLVGVEHHLLCLARIGAHEHHPAVAEAEVRDLHRRGHAVHDDDLMAPVELVGLARRERQRDEGARRRTRMLLPPTYRITANGGVAAVKAEPLQFLENADQRQTLARRFLPIGIQQSLEPFPPRPKPRHRLPGSLVTKLSRARPNDFPHHLARNPQFAADLLDRLAL